MKLLWIGINYNEEIRSELLSYHAKILSGAISQESLIAGVDFLGYKNMDTINSYRYPVYPQGPLNVGRKEWSRTSESKDISVGYLNVKYICHSSRSAALKKEVKKWAEGIPEDEDVLAFVYSMHSPFLAAANELKKLHKRTKVAMFVLDLPQFMDMHMSRVKKMLKDIDWKSICKYMKCVDKYILYSKHMAEFLKLKDGSWMVMEGSYDPTLIIDDSEIKKDDEKISVMYSGVLDLRYGIKELLDTMPLLGENYVLWLTGNGNAVPLIKERAEKDPRIKYYGFLPSRLDLLRKQHEATMLISTRNPSEEASAYCFPSKIFEYMVSGNPVLSTEIKGIPDEYFEHMIALPDIKPETLAKKIIETAEMPKAEREAFGKAASEFIIENKNNVAQIKRVLEFLEI